MAKTIAIVEEIINGFLVSSIDSDGSEATLYFETYDEVLEDLSELTDDNGVEYRESANDQFEAVKLCDCK